MDTVSVVGSYLNMREAGKYIGQSYRWMQRNYIDLIKNGVPVFRLPKDSPKGRLVFERAGLDQYMFQCRIEGNFETFG